MAGQRKHEYARHLPGPVSEPHLLLQLRWLVHESQSTASAGFSVVNGRSATRHIKVRQQSVHGSDASVYPNADWRKQTADQNFNELSLIPLGGILFSRPSGVPLSREEKIQPRQVNDGFSELHYKTEDGRTASGDVNWSSFCWVPVDFRKRVQAWCCYHVGLYMRRGQV